MLLVEWTDGCLGGAARRCRGVVAALPPFTSLSPDGEFIQNDMLSDAHAIAHYRGEQAFLEANDDGYADEQIAAAWMRSQGYAGNVS